ncbi:hypothetical protein F0562_024116 [Nyssa sinensis]|uniref:Uncharacterized protein n=1 Tax=Nyssa sinensis TaxID=561372 RepID=A0A5J5BL64_9ASTE|nr:hypothetical protein F0562_024116 [Nyssa sinensis]
MYLRANVDEFKKPEISGSDQDNSANQSLKKGLARSEYISPWMGRFSLCWIRLMSIKGFNKVLWAPLVAGLDLKAETSMVKSVRRVESEQVRFVTEVSDGQHEWKFRGGTEVSSSRAGRIEMLGT